MKGSGQFRVTIGFFLLVLATVIAPYFSKTFNALLFCYLETLYFRKLLRCEFSLVFMPDLGTTSCTRPTERLTPANSPPL